MPPETEGPAPTEADERRESQAAHSRTDITTGAKGPATASTAPPGGSSGRAGRWWLGVIAGCVVAAPLSWLLSYAGALPFFLGVFFFALFGLLIGATVFRVAAAGRPYARWHVLVGTTIVVSFGWGMSLVKEARDFPQDLAIKAVDRTRDIGTLTREQFKVHIADGVRTWLRANYPPGGTIGYVRWTLANGRIEKNAIPDLSRSLQNSQRGWVWAVRVVLSIALFSFGIGSQTFLLRTPASRRT